MLDSDGYNEFASNLVARNLVHITRFIATATTSAKEAVETKLSTSFREYILNTANCYGLARTFFIRNEQKPLYNYYVPLDLKHSSGDAFEANIGQLEKTNNKIVLTGHAGCGKSTLMRHLLLDSIKSGKRFPIFVELNQFSGTDSGKLLEQCFEGRWNDRRSLPLVNGCG